LRPKNLTQLETFYLPKASGAGFLGRKGHREAQRTQRKFKIAFLFTPILFTKFLGIFAA